MNNNSKFARKIQGAILFEAAICFLLNMIIIIGCIEAGHYLYVRQAIVGAVGAVTTVGNEEDVSFFVRAYLRGMNIAESNISFLDISIETVERGPDYRIQKVQLSLPSDRVLLFSGQIGSFLIKSPKLVAVGYQRHIIH